MTALLNRPTDATSKKKLSLAKKLGSKVDPSDQSRTPPVSAKARRGADALVIGGRPSVDLLPLEIRSLRRSQGVVRMSVALVAIVVAVVVAAIVLVTLLAGSSADALIAAQGRTASLVAAQGRFIEGRTASDEISSLNAARSYATQSEIDWTSFLAAIRSGLPEGATIDNAVAAAPPQWESALAPADDLRAERVATITITVLTPTSDGLIDWVRSLPSVPGYADATVDSVIFSPESDEGYRATVTLNLGEGARSGRFAISEG